MTADEVGLSLVTCWSLTITALLRTFNWAFLAPLYPKFALGCFVVQIPGSGAAFGMVKTDPPKLSEIQVGHPAPAATRAAYRAADERRLRQSASSPALPAVPQLQARPTASTSPVSRRGYETRARTPDGGGGLVVATRPPSQPTMRSPGAKPLRSPPSQSALQRPAWYPAELSTVAGGGACTPSAPTRPGQQGLFLEVCL